MDSVLTGGQLISGRELAEHLTTATKISAATAWLHERTQSLARVTVPQCTFGLRNVPHELESKFDDVSFNPPQGLSSK